MAVQSLLHPTGYKPSFKQLDLFHPLYLPGTLKTYLSRLTLTPGSGEITAPVLPVIHTSKPKSREATWLWSVNVNRAVPLQRLWSQSLSQCFPAFFLACTENTMHTYKIKWENWGHFLMVGLQMPWTLSSSLDGWGAQCLCLPLAHLGHTDWKAVPIITASLRRITVTSPKPIPSPLLTHSLLSWYCCMQRLTAGCQSRCLNSRTQHLCHINL